MTSPDYKTAMVRWHQEPMTWLLIALPLLAVLGCVITMRIAFLEKADTVPDAVAKTGQMQIADLSADIEAAAADIRATIVLDAATRHVGLSFTHAPMQCPASLILHLQHPIDAAADRALDFTREKDANCEYRAPIMFDPGVGWRLSLSSQDGAWRLSGAWAKHGYSAILVSKMGNIND